MTNPSRSREMQADIERACTRLVLDAADYTDQQDYVGLAALFQPQGKLYRPTDPEKPIVGREAILAAYQARPPHRFTRHFCSNIRVTVETPERARVRCYVQVFAANAQHDRDGCFGWPLDGRVMIGEFDDICLAEEGNWYFGERRARFVMHQNI